MRYIFSWDIPKEAQNSVFQVVQSQNLKISLWINEKVKNTVIFQLIFCSFHGRGVLTYRLLSPKPNFLYFQSLIKKMFCFEFWDVIFLYLEITNRQIQTSHEITNTMKHDRVAGLRKTANFSREYKARAVVALNRSFSGWYSKLPESSEPCTIFYILGTFWTMENNKKT